MNRSRALSVLYVAPFLVAVLWLFLPTILGSETLFLRDVFNTHLEMKTFQADAWRSGELPLIDDRRGGGQPQLGNPNTVPLYPDNLLYLIAPPLWALNAHFWLHLLLAPVSVFYLGRRVGLGRLPAWSAGVFYATSGYFLSTLNLYNLSAATALTPAFLGACIALGQGEVGGNESVEEVASTRCRRERTLVLVAGLWALLVLGGDPMTAVTALLVGATGLALATAQRRIALLRLVLAVALGTLVAAPQVVEFLRIVPGSYRGIQGYSVAAATAASWSPVNLVEWVLPMVFGEPNLEYWGAAFHAGRLPLFYSFYPGLIALVLVVVGSRGGRSWVKWSWGLVLVGIFFAMGSYNPIAEWTLGLPGMSIFRLPVKLWVLVGSGLALLAGFGVQRFLDRKDRWLERGLMVLVASVALAWLSLEVGSAWWTSWLEGWMPARSPGHAAAEVERWAGVLAVSLALSVVALLVTRWAGQRVAVAGGLLLAIHVAGQVLLLGPLVPTDEVSAYSSDHPLLESIPSDARVVHASAGGLFGPVRLELSAYPDASTRWLQRDTFAQLYPTAGAIAGRRYEFWTSAEGLDSFLTRSATQALPLLDDPRRLSLLEASGVTHLLLPRDLDGVEADRALVLERGEWGTADLRLFELPRSADEVQFVGRILRSEDSRQTLRLLTDPSFDARSSAVMAGEGPPLLGGRGAVREVDSRREAVTARVRVEAPGAVLFQRSYLPIYSARLNGEPTEIVLANLHRLAVEVPVGDHLVELFVDRRSVRPAFLVSALGILLLLLRMFRSPLQSAPSTPGAEIGGGR